MRNASIVAMIIGLIGIGASLYALTDGQSFKDIFNQFFISFTLFGYALIQLNKGKESNQ